MRYSDNIRLAHAWAHQMSAEGSASNFFFEENTIYSYGRHFPIAIINGHDVFCTLRSYSKTTSAHRTLALSEVSHKRKVFVQFVPTASDLNGARGFVKLNLEYWIESIKRDCSLFAARPRKKSYLKSINETICLIRAFAEAVSEELPQSLEAILENPVLNSFRAFESEMKIKKRKRKSKSGAGK